MDFCSQVIENCLAFGPYPDPESFPQLSEFDLCLDLTEQIVSTYDFSIKIRYPIEDTKIPIDMNSFNNLMELLVASIHNGKKIYIHCKYGRGRSSMVTILLLVLAFDYTLDEAIETVNRSYKNGHGKYSLKEVPPHKIQRKFIRKYLKNLK